MCDGGWRVLRVGEECVRLSMMVRSGGGSHVTVVVEYVRGCLGLRSLWLPRQPVVDVRFCVDLQLGFQEYLYSTGAVACPTQYLARHVRFISSHLWQFFC